MRARIRFGVYCLNEEKAGQYCFVLNTVRNYDARPLQDVTLAIDEDYCLVIPHHKTHVVSSLKVLAENRGRSLLWDPLGLMYEARYCADGYLGKYSTITQLLDHVPQLLKRKRGPKPVVTRAA